MNVNNINSMAMYNNIQYERLQTQRPFDTYTPNIPKAINNHKQKSNSMVRRIPFSIKSSIPFLLQSIGQMTPITNISIQSPANTIVTTSQPALTYTTSGLLQKQQQSQNDYVDDEIHIINAS